ncbi:MAG: O-antigen ligase family protein [Kiritimatiellae bacterium]|nr:O-antigen ligase family protein [Kiritimatiellia bacterium]
MSLWAFRFLLWYICILLVQPQNRFPVLWPLHIANGSFIAAVVLHILACLKDGRAMLRLGPATKLGLALMFFTLLTSYGSPYQSWHGWGRWTDIIFKNALLMICIEAMCTTVRRAWVVQMTTLVCTLWWVKGGLRLSAAGATYSGDRLMGAAIGLIENPNSFAYMMCLFLPLYLYAFEETRQKWLRWSFLACAVAAVYIVFQTGSRTGLVTLLAMAVFSVPHYQNLRWRNVLLVAVAIAVIFPMTGERNRERFRTIPASMAAFLGGKKEKQDGPLTQDQQSADERQAKNRDTWRLIKDYPLFGVGFETDSRFLEPYPMARGQVHSEILAVGKQMGFIGMGLFLGVLGMSFAAGLRIQRVFRDRPEVGKLGWVFCMQSLLIMVGGFFCPLPWHPPMMILAGSASALAGLARQRDESGTDFLAA